MVDLSCAVDTIIFLGCNNRRITSKTVVLRILASCLQNNVINIKLYRVFIYVYIQYKEKYVKIYTTNMVVRAIITFIIFIILSFFEMFYFLLYQKIYYHIL